MDPKDQIIGQPREYDVWLSPDWGDWSEKTKKANDWRRVSVRETHYADGRVVSQVLDENRAPITNRVLDQSIDKDQETRFQKEQNNSAPPGGATTKTINGAVFQWNPQTRAYDIPTGAAPAPARSPEQQTVDAAAAAKAQREQQEREANAKLPPSQDPAYETDAERRDRGARVAAQQAAAANVAADNRRADEAAQRQAQAANKPGAPTLSPDGKGGTIAIQTMPDGSIKTTPLPNIPSNAQEITLDNRRYRLNPSTGKYEDVTPQAPQLPTDVPQFRPDASRPSYGLDDYVKLLQEYRKAHPNLTDDQVKQIVIDAHASAKAEESRLTNLATIQQTAQNAAITQRSQDVTRQNALGTAATSAFAQASDNGNKLLGAIAPDKWAGNVITPGLAQAAANAAGYGALGMPPAVPTPPIIQAMSQFGLGGPPAMAPVNAVPPVGPAPTVAPTLAPVAPAQAEAERQRAMAQANIGAPGAPASAATLTPTPGPAMQDGPPGGPTMVPPHNAGTDTRLPVTGSGTVNLPQGVDLSTPPAQWQGSGGPVGMTPVIPAMRGFGIPPMDLDAWAQAQHSGGANPIWDEALQETLRQIRGGVAA